MKLIGVNYSDDRDVAKILVFLEKLGMLQKRNMIEDTGQFRVNPDKIFGGNNV